MTGGVTVVWVIVGPVLFFGGIFLAFLAEKRGWTVLGFVCVFAGLLACALPFLVAR